MNTDRIYKIVGRGEWAEAERVGAFAGSAVDLADGFIHFSTRHQLAETLTKHFSGQTNLLLVSVDAKAVRETLKWEPSRNDELFPHLYADLPLPAVVSVVELPLDKDGRHILSPAIE